MKRPYGRQVIGIRCHQIGAPEKRLFAQLQSAFDIADIYFVVDYRINRNLGSEEKSIVLVDPSNLGVETLDDWGWRCGDLFYYAFSRAIEAEFFYLIEPDVWLTKHTARELFAATSKSTADFIANNIAQAKENWSWSKLMLPFDHTVYACSFPITRLSRKVVSTLHSRRKEINGACLKQGLLIPNDESFVASTICRDTRFQYAQLYEFGGVVLSKFSTMNQIPIELCNQDTFIYHSALDWNGFAEKFERRYGKSDDMNLINKALDFSFGSATITSSLRDKIRQYMSPRILEAFLRWEKARE